MEKQPRSGLLFLFWILPEHTVHFDGLTGTSNIDARVTPKIKALATTPKEVPIEVNPPLSLNLSQFMSIL